MEDKELITNATQLLSELNKKCHSKYVKKSNFNYKVWYADL